MICMPAEQWDQLFWVDLSDFGRTADLAEFPIMLIGIWIKTDRDTNSSIKVNTDTTQRNQIYYRARDWP